MKLAQLVTGPSPKPAANKDFEEKRISGMGKDELDREIVRELKQGWLIKARSHASEGLHGVTLYRRRGPRLVGG